MAEWAMGVVVGLKHPRPGQQSQEPSPAQELVRRQACPPQVVQEHPGAGTVQDKERKGGSL